MMANRAPKKLAPEALWEYALRVLGNRSHSAVELSKKLQRRAQSSLDVTSVMSKLREYGLADDKKFSESFASARLANSGVGRFRVLRDLRAKQVPAPIAEKAISSAFAGIDEEQLAESFLLRRYRGKDLAAFLAEEKNLARAYRRLRTGGFSAGATMSVLKRYSRQAGDFDEPEEAE
jgi:regulatory protein